MMSMADRDGLIWYDGKMVPWRDATTHVLTHSLHYGMGVFEGVRAYKTNNGTAIFRLKEHTDRLFRSAHIFGMKMPFDKETISQAQIEAVRQNKLESGYIRPLAFYGAEAMGISAKTLSVHMVVAAWPWGAYLGKDALEHGIRVKTSSFTRHHVNITMCKAKASSSYTNSILAHQEAPSPLSTIRALHQLRTWSHSANARSRYASKNSPFSTVCPSLKSASPATKCIVRMKHFLPAQQRK